MTAVGTGKAGSRAGKSSTYFIREDQNTWIVYLSDTKNGGGCCAFAFMGSA